MGADDSSPPRATVEVRLAEFHALRQEIAQRSSFQHGLIVLNLTALGAVMGLVFGQDVDETFLLVVPVISPALGILWFGNHVHIIRIGNYIGTMLWTWTPSWELWLTECEPNELRWWNRTWWPTVQLIFCGPPAVILATGPFLQVGSVTEWTLWSMGFVLTAYLAIASTLLSKIARPADRPQEGAGTGADD
jgi:hypothetical protein